jgi:hypothetical protein
MAASTITRDTWTNDSGSFASPAGDGTVLANTILQNHIYARIDAMFAGAGSYTTFTLGGKLAVEGFGTHSVSAGGTGSNLLLVRNTTAGTGNAAVLELGNDSVAGSGILSAYASTFTTASYQVAGVVSLWAQGPGGLSLATGWPTGHMRFYTAGTEFLRLNASGGLAFNSTADPGIGAFCINGVLLVNTTGRYSSELVSIRADSATNTGLFIGSTNAANVLTYVGFVNSASGIAGSITQTGASTVSYGTSSDARLKSDEGRAQDVSALRQLVIHDFTWKADGVKDRGVFAQEAYPLFPRAVIQGSDATTPDGTLTQPWMTDYTKFIPDVIAGWQAHDASISDLLARVAALEAV